MQHVFVAYKHEDLDFAENVINRVEKAGYSTWTDDKLHAGEDWRAMIDIAIKNGFALIVIMMPEAKASGYVTYEWAFAWGVGVKVIPLMLRPTQLHPRLEALQYLDFTNPKIRPWERLIEEIKSAAHAPLSNTINIPLNSPPYVRQAVMALDSPNESDRVAAVRTLQRVNTPETQTVLIEALQRPIGDVRRAAAQALGEMGVTSVVPALIQLLHDSETGVRAAAAEALGKLGDTTAITVLAERLDDLDIDKSESKATALAMGRLGDVRAVPKLVEIIGTQYAEVDYGVRHEEWEEIGCTVGSLGDSTLIPALEEAKETIKYSINGYRQQSAVRDAIRTLCQRTDAEKQRNASKL